MPTHTLMSSVRNKVENKVNGLRWYEPPSEVRVYDLQGNFKRIEQPPIADDRMGYFNNRRR